MMNNIAEIQKLKITKPPVMNYYCAESINSICTNIMFAGKDVRTVMITSCTASEGKSTTAARILVSMAKRGKRTLLIDADLRRSMAAGKLGLRGDGKLFGLAHLLAGQKKLQEVLYETNIPNAYIIPVGREVSNPVSLINSAAFKNTFDELKKHFDFIIVDTPPIGVVIDAADIAHVCDGSIIVIEYGKRHRHEVQDAANQMKRTGTPILGCVIDKVAPSSLSEKKYYNSHYYYNKYDKNGYYSAGSSNDKD